MKGAACCSFEQKIYLMLVQHHSTLNKSSKVNFVKYCCLTVFDGHSSVFHTVKVTFYEIKYSRVSFCISRNNKFVLLVQ